MSNRHLSRIVALQSLYEANFRGGEKTKEIVLRNIDSRKEKVDDSFIEKIIAGVKKNEGEIDKFIEKSAPEWPIEQIATVDKTILRMAIFELLYDNEVPPKVAIDEAVELAKAYGGENSSKFVNGVLGTVYRSSDKYNSKEDKNPPAGGKESQK
jgi:N utilization substance protein B